MKHAKGSYTNAAMDIHTVIVNIGVETTESSMKKDPKKERERLIVQNMKATGLPRETVESWFPQLQETETDLVREGQSVVNYFETRGAGFLQETCRSCNKIFAYSYHIKAVKFCSISCLQKDLQEKGLEWNPYKTPGQRWGKYAPAVVPPDALKELEDLL